MGGSERKEPRPMLRTNRRKIATLQETTTIQNMNRNMRARKFIGASATAAG